MGRQCVYTEIVKGLTGAGGIESHFCDWNKPSRWNDKPTPADVERWVLERIKEILEIEEGSE